MAEQPGVLRSDVSIARNPQAFDSAPASGRSIRRPRTRYKALLSPCDAAELLFEDFGAVCRRDDLGEHFNFPQRWVPYSGVPMSTLFGDSPQTLSLALNLLDYYCRFSKPDPRASAKAHPLARQLTEQFAAEMLAPLAGCAWHLPIESIEHWVKGHSR